MAHQAEGRIVPVPGPFWIAGPSRDSVSALGFDPQGKAPAPTARRRPSAEQLWVILAAAGMAVAIVASVVVARPFTNAAGEGRGAAASYSLRAQAKVSPHALAMLNSAATNPVVRVKKDWLVIQRQVVKIREIAAAQAARAQAEWIATHAWLLAHKHVVPLWRPWVIGAKFGQIGKLWGGGFHTGIDLDVPVGTSVRAFMAGRVVASDVEGPYGNCILILHTNGIMTRYAHLSKRAVRKGQWVWAGSYIGKVGMTGNTTGPHLHFEVIVHGKPVNPMPYLYPTTAPSSSASRHSRSVVRGS